MLLPELSAGSGQGCTSLSCLPSRPGSGSWRLQASSPVCIVLAAPPAGMTVSHVCFAEWHWAPPRLQSPDTGLAPQP